MLRVAVMVTAALVSGSVAHATATPRPGVTVYTPPSGEPLAARLQAELYAVGIEARLVPIAEDAVAPAPVLRGETQAVIRVAPGGNGTEVWVVDSGGAGTLRQSLTSSSRAMAAVVALRTMEFLRASLLPEPEATRRPALAPPLPPPTEISEVIVAPARPAPPAPAPALRATLGPALLMSPGGFGAMAAGSLRAAWHPSRSFGAEVLGIVGLSSTEVGSAEGTSNLWTALVGGGATAVLPLADRFELDAGAGLLAVLLRASGDPNQPFIAASETTTAAAGYARTGLAARATDHLSVRADVLAGFTMQRLLVHAGDSDVADWGRPFVAASLGLQASWF